jgi:hypothetical protein
MILSAYAVGSWPQLGCTVALEDIGARRGRSLISPLLLLCEMIDRLRAWFLLGAFARLIRSIEGRRDRWEDMALTPAFFSHHHGKGIFYYRKQRGFPKGAGKLSYALVTG